MDVVAAYELYGGPCIVIDFGTATTYDLVGADGTFEAGVISPGIKICTKALWNETAKLPEIEIKKPESILLRIQFHVCRQVLFMDTSVRQNILLKR